MKRKLTFKKMLVTVLMILTVTVLLSVAAAADTIPKKVRAYPKSISSVSIDFTTSGDHVKNVKGSKYLKTKLTYSNYSGDESSTEESSTEIKGSATISFQARKKGVHKITFDVYSGANKKKSTKTIKVYAYSSAPFKYVKFNGKKLLYSSSYGNSGKLSVKMNSGYKLVKIEVGKYDKGKTVKDDYSTTTEREMIYKKVNNNSKITLGKYPFYYVYDYKDHTTYSHIENTSVDAETLIQITYWDKYTKQNEVSTYYLWREVW